MPLFLISKVVSLDLAMQIPTLLRGLQKIPLILPIFFFQEKFYNNQEHIALFTRFLFILKVYHD